MKKLLLSQAVFFILILINNDLNAQITYLNAIESNNKNAIDMIISPDNKFAYVIATGELQTYQRNPANGQLSFLSSISQMSGSIQLYHISTLEMSYDTKFIYTLGTSNAYVFSRDTSTGLLTPFQTLSDGYYPNYYPTIINNIVASKDGKNVYITGRQNLFIYERDSTTGTLSLIDTLQNLNYVSGFGFENSVELSADNRLAFITGAHSVSIFSRDTITGLLTLKNTISGNNFVNQGLSYASQSVSSSDDRFLYTVTNSQGTGALVVLSRNSITDSLSIIQTYYNNIRPQYINISSDNKLICISSGAAGIGPGSLIFFKTDSTTGMVEYISKYEGADKYGRKKCIDMDKRYFYTCPSFTDSIYIHKFNLFLDSTINICLGDSVKLKPWDNYISYLWSTNSPNSSITVNTPGTYFLTVEDNSGYPYSDSIIVTAQSPPTLTLGNDTTLYLGQSLYLSPGNNYNSWNWNINNNTSPFLYLTHDSSFFGIKMIIVSVTNNYNCISSDTIFVTYSQDTTAHLIINQDNFYPNPFSSWTNLKTNSKFNNATLTISNYLGQTVKQITNIDGQTVTLHRDDLLSGLYIVRLIENNEIVMTKKIVITD